MKSINLFGLILDNTNYMCNSQHYYTYYYNNIEICACEGGLRHDISIYVRDKYYICDRIYISEDASLNAQDTFNKDSVIILKALLKFCKRTNLVYLQEKLSKYEMLL